jgi:hypothetical protein
MAADEAAERMAAATDEGGKTTAVREEEEVPDEAAARGTEEDEADVETEGPGNKHLSATTAMKKGTSHVIARRTIGAERAQAACTTAEWFVRSRLYGATCVTTTKRITFGTASPRVNGRCERP